MSDAAHYVLVMGPHDSARFRQALIRFVCRGAAPSPPPNHNASATINKFHAGLGLVIDARPLIDLIT